MKPILCSRPDRVGDVIISTACLPALRRVFPDAPVLWLSRHVMRPLFTGEGGVDGFWSLDEFAQPNGGCDLSEQLRASEVQAMLHFHPDPLVERAAADAGVPLRCGWTSSACATSPFLTHSLPYRKSEGKKHEAEYTMDIVRLAAQVRSSKSDNTKTLHDLPPCDRYHLAPDPAAERSLLDRFPWLGTTSTSDATARGPWLLVNPTTARLDLRWPVAYFDQVIRQLISEFPEAVPVLIGHPPDDPALKQLRQKWRNLTTPWHDLSGVLNLGELAWLMRRSALHISRDTGTSHLASAMNCSQVAVMGRPEAEFSPTRWAPLGPDAAVVASQAKRRFYETRRMFWRRSFRSVRPEQVTQAALPLLKKSLETL